MRNLIVAYLALTSLCSFGQHPDSIGVFIPKDDASPFSWPRKHMWVGRQNRITSTNEIIKAWTDNGVVDSSDYSRTDYRITPLDTGNVQIFSIQKIWNGTKYDMIQTKSIFRAIIPPQISLKVKKDTFKNDSTISFSLVDRCTQQPLDNRYQLGVMHEPLVYDSFGVFIGRIDHCYGLTISFADYYAKELEIKSGYKVKIQVWVRDIETDLLISTNELIYTLN